MKIASITVDDVFSVLRPIWATKTETAVRVKDRISRVLSAAGHRAPRPRVARWKDYLKNVLGDNEDERGWPRHAAYGDV